MYKFSQPGTSYKVLDSVRKSIYIYIYSETFWEQVKMDVLLALKQRQKYRLILDIYIYRERECVYV